MHSSVRQTIFLAAIPFEKLVALGVVGQTHLVAEFNAFRSSEGAFEAGSVCVPLGELDMAADILPNGVIGTTAVAAASLASGPNTAEEDLADVYFNEGALYARLEPMIEILGSRLLSGKPFERALVARDAPIHGLRDQWRAVVLEWVAEVEDRRSGRFFRASPTIKAAAADILFDRRVEEIRLTNHTKIASAVLSASGAPDIRDAVARLWQVEHVVALDFPAVERAPPPARGGPLRESQVAVRDILAVEPEEVEGAYDEPGNIEPDVLAVLRRCSATDTGVSLPNEQLDRKLYAKVNDVLNALGGKWTTAKKCHVFKEDPRVLLEVVQATGQYTNPKDFGFFWTPSELATRVARMCRLETGMSLFEPSGGHGALADAAAAIVGAENVETCELLPRNAAVLRTKGYKVVEADFLQLEPTPRFDRVLMNPPFGKQADMKHVEHAARFLKPDGLLVSIMSPSFVTRSTKQAAQFRALMDAAGEGVEKVPAGAFSASGTNVSTVIVTLDASRFPWNLEVDAAEQAGRLGDAGRSFQCADAGIRVERERP